MSKSHLIGDDGIHESQRALTKKRIYEIIEVAGPNDHASKAYDILINCMILVSLYPLMVKGESNLTRLMDLLAFLVFLVDYVMRLYTADYKMGFLSVRAYIAYIFTPMAIVDLLSIIPVITFFFPTSTLVQLLRIFRVLRVLKLVRYSKAMVSIANVYHRVKGQLLAVLVVTLVYIITTAMVIFQVEPDQFPTFFDAIYWSTVSITTIGYGDISPVTTTGRFITIISALVGVAVIALPSGIITAGYMREITKKKTKHEL